MDFTNLECGDHSAFCCLFCNSCDFLVCPTCVAKDHKTHDLKEISEGYHQTLDRIKDVKLSIKQTISKLKTIKGNLQQFKAVQKNKMAHEEQQIENHRIDDIHNDKLISDFRQNGVGVFTAIDNDIQTIQKVEQEVNEKDKELERLIKTTDSKTFFTDVLRLKTSQDNIVPQAPSMLTSIPKFVPRDITLSHVGELQKDSNKPSVSPQVYLQINEEYQTQLSAISHLCSCFDGSLWLGSNIDDMINEVRPDKDKLKVVSTFNTSIYGMTCNASNDLLISTSETKPQQIDSKTKKISDTVYDITPFDVTSIHVTTERKVLVGGICDELDKRAVFVIDKDGGHERIFEHDNNGWSLFTYPYEITSTSNGYIHVVDCHPSHDRGRIVVLSQGGNMNIYCGHPDVNKDTPFIPASIATTPRDNVVVVDHYTWYLHILDNTGQLLTVYNTKDAGIQLPESLAFMSTGALWIGCSTPDGSDAKAKLYNVNLSEY